MRELGTEKFSCLHKVTQLIRGSVRKQVQIVWTPVLYTLGPVPQRGGPVSATTLSQKGKGERLLAGQGMPPDSSGPPGAVEWVRMLCGPQGGGQVLEPGAGAAPCEGGPAAAHRTLGKSTEASFGPREMATVTLGQPPRLTHSPCKAAGAQASLRRGGPFLAPTRTSPFHR